MPDESLPFMSRFLFAWTCFFRVLFDPDFAARAFAVRERALPPPTPPESTSDAGANVVVQERAHRVSEPARPTYATPALQLLAILQRDGRLIDFLEEDISSASDEDVGAAARVVHEKCGKALRAHAKIAPLREEAEGSRVTLGKHFDPGEIKLVGNVSGAGPFLGTLRHRGWRVTQVSLPVAVKGHDTSIVAQAEVEV